MAWIEPRQAPELNPQLADPRHLENLLDEEPMEGTILLLYVQRCKIRATHNRVIGIARFELMSAVASLAYSS